MTTTLTLYTGNIDTNANTIQRKFAEWVAEQGTMLLICKSIHDEPAIAVRLQIRSLPALVMQDRLIAQGTPAQWLNEHFFADVTSKVLSVQKSHH